MFVLLIGLPGPRPFGLTRTSFPPIKCCWCGSISRLPTRALYATGRSRGQWPLSLPPTPPLSLSLSLSRLSFSLALVLSWCCRCTVKGSSLRRMLAILYAVMRGFNAPTCLSAVRVAFAYACQRRCSFSLNEPARREIIDDVSEERCLYRVAVRRFAFC